MAGNGGGSRTIRCIGLNRKPYALFLIGENCNVVIAAFEWDSTDPWADYNFSNEMTVEGNDLIVYFKLSYAATFKFLKYVAIMDNPFDTGGGN